MASRAPLSIGVASLNRAKRAAVEQVFRGHGVLHTLTAESVPSGVRPQPMSDEETIQGALNRARALMEAHPTLDLAIAFEGGVERTLFGTFLCEWCVVINSFGTPSFGSGPRIALPAAVIREIDAGHEVGAAFDNLVGRLGTGSSDGAYGILTGNEITRTEVGAQALIVALAEQLRPDVYGSPTGANVIVDAFRFAPPKKGNGKRRLISNENTQLKLQLS